MLRHLSSSLGLVVILASASACSPRHVSEDTGHGTHGVDLGYKMAQPLASEEADSIPGGAQMNEIVRQGARAVSWFELIQKEVAPEKREQLWRKIDGVGKEPTFEAPLKYNPKIIQDLFDTAMAAFPASVASVVRARGELPAQLPAGVTLADTVVTFRKVDKAYSRASRWLALYEWHDELRKDGRDLRPWLKLQASKDAFASDAAAWSGLSPERRRAWFEAVIAACPVMGQAVSKCRTENEWVLDEGQAEDAQALFDRVLRRGQRRYDTKFGVQLAHPGVTRAVGADGTVRLGFSMLNVRPDILSWISTQVSQGWEFPGSVGVDLVSVAAPVNGVVKVEWEAGALPHVNEVGGDTITMDANEPQWLEQARVTMTHEFGHVIGLPDCYIEFWDETESDGGAFVFYSLDPTDRMCALSGDTHPRHRQALLEGFPDVAVTQQAL